MKLADKKIALSEMLEELRQQKKAAEEFYDDIKDVKPEDVELDTGDVEDTGKEEHPAEIKTPEDAKKVLDEATKDIQQVIDNIDGVIGQGEDEEVKIAYRRPSDKYASVLNSLSVTANNAIDDAQAALKHWAFLSKRIRPKKKEANLTTEAISHPELKQVAKTLEEMSILEKVLDKMGFTRKATAVPPTGAKFTGDKWPEGKDPKDVEDRQWHAGADEFKRDKKKEDSMPNSAVEDRLIDAGNPHDEKPYVNASYNDLGRYWDVVDKKAGKAIRFSFANAPLSLGPKDEKGLARFASKAYGSRIISVVMSDGIEAARQIADAQYINIREAAKGDSKASVRKYYTDAYGDASYAKDLTAKKNTDEMNVEYKPKDDEVKDNDFKTKDGPGKISSVQDPTVIKAKAANGVRIARLAAAAGIIDFNKQSIKQYAKDLMDKSEETLAMLEATLQEAELVNQAALDTTAFPTIPLSASGIVAVVCKSSCFRYYCYYS